MTITYLGPAQGTGSTSDSVWRRKRTPRFPGYSAVQVNGMKRGLRNDFVFISHDGANIVRVGLTPNEQLKGRSHSPGLTSVATGRGPWA